MAQLKRNAYGYELPMVEEYLSSNGAVRYGVSGSGLKPDRKAAARAAANTFAQTGGAPRHRDFFRSQLIGAGVAAEAAAIIADESEVATSQ